MALFIVFFLQMFEVLFLVFGEVCKIPQQKCLYYGNYFPVRLFPLLSDLPF
jgi:hypothetical protein